MIFTSLLACSADKPNDSAQKAFNPFAEAWTHVSTSSAVIFWQAGTDARRVESTGTGYVEYGPTAAYGSKTKVFGMPPVSRDVPEKVRAFQKPSWSQFHRITGLEVGKPVHYRMVYVAPDGRVTRGEDQVVAPRANDNAIGVSNELHGAPRVLNKAGATYVLKSDLVADGTAIEIAADNITLDLDGHKIIYGRKAGDRVYGVSVKNRKGVKILNGVIEEGKGSGRRRYPMFLQGCRNMEIAGLDITYHGKDGQGILFNWQGADSNVHHNVICDNGTETSSRHQQIGAIHFSPAVGNNNTKVHHNIVFRTRQTGIQFSASEAAARQGKVQAENFEIYNNMVYIGSCMTNSMGVSATGALRNFELRNNRIYGRGEMPECIFVGTGASYGKVSGNYTYSRSTGKVSKEYGSGGSLSAAFRMCWGPHHIEAFNNTFITVSGLTDGFRGNARNIWAACSDPRQREWKTSGEIDIHDNEIIAINETRRKTYARAITVCGHHEASSHGLKFRNNRVTTNANCVVLSESYGAGSSDVKFIGNTFVKADKPGKFMWLKCGYWNKPTTGTVFIDNKFEGGASVGDISFDGTAERDISVGWTLTVKTTPEAAVTITDRTGKEVFKGKADANGLCVARLLQYRQTPKGKTSLTPHTVKIAQGGKSATKTVTMDKVSQIELRPAE